MTFENDQARRDYFLEKLREKLKDPEFRAMPGFPKGSDENILRLSDPPYYTACPNPFLADFVSHHGRSYDPNEPYHREPFAVDVSEGKTDPLYKAHGYHTKVPHLAIVPSILHYTNPGDLVLDGFAGSGMTGVAAQWCGAASESYRRKLEKDWQIAGLGKPNWGARRAIIGDLSPAASFIAANYNLPFDVQAFEKAARGILKEVEDEIGWMYETLHTDGKTKGRINYTVWSEVFSCPDCTGEIVFLDEALDKTTKRVKEEFFCPHCNAELTKNRLERFYESTYDSIIGEMIPDSKQGFLAGFSPQEQRFIKTKKIRLIRLEAVRAGFAYCYQNRDYRTIIAVALRIPEKVLQEDEKLLMWYDQAVTRSGAE
jgi:hypothetical protein